MCKRNTLQGNYTAVDAIVFLGFGELSLHKNL